MPSDTASYVWTLSGGHITAEILEFLLWELPLKIGNQLIHASVLNMPMQQCLKTVPIDADNIQSEVDRMTAIVIARMQKEKSK
jgi:hypothetical protein